MAGCESDTLPNSPGREETLLSKPPITIHGGHVSMARFNMLSCINFVQKPIEIHHVLLARTDEREESQTKISNQ